MNSLPGTGRTALQFRSRGSSAVSSSRSSAWSGSVSWNSSTKMRAHRCCSCRANRLVAVHQVARAVQQVEEVQLAAARLQLLVAVEAAAQLVAQQRRQIRVGVALEDVELQHQLLQGLVGRASREALGEVRAVALAGAAEVAIAAQVDQQRLGAVEIAGLDQHRQLVAGPPRRGGVEIQRIAQARRFARDRGERADARRQAIDLGRALEVGPRPRRREVAPLGQVPARRPQAVHGAVGVGVAAGTRPARAPQRAPHALGHLLERGLEPRRKRLVVAAPRLVLGEDDEQRIDTGLDRILLEQVGAEAVDRADLRLFEAAERVVERLPLGHRQRRGARASRAPAAAAASARRPPSP